MKKTIFRVLIISTCMFIFLSGCAGERGIYELYKVTYNDDFTYDYVVKDRNHNVLVSGEGVSREPKINVITEDLLSVSVQTGTGLSTCWTIYCDVLNGKVSTPYYSVLGEYGKNVVYVNFDGGTHSIVIQNIFHQEQCCKETALADASKVADPVVAFEELDNGKAKLIYLKGEACEETTITIDLQ